MTPRRRLEFQRIEASQMGYKGGGGGGGEDGGWMYSGTTQCSKMLGVGWGVINAFMCLLNLKIYIESLLLKNLRLRFIVAVILDLQLAFISNGFT